MTEQEARKIAEKELKGVNVADIVFLSEEHDCFNYSFPAERDGYGFANGLSVYKKEGRAVVWPA